MILLFFKREIVSIPQIFASETYYQSIIIAYCWFSDQIALNLDWIQFLTNFKLRSPAAGVEQHPGEYGNWYINMKRHFRSDFQ